MTRELLWSTDAFCDVDRALELDYDDSIATDRKGIHMKKLFNYLWKLK